VVIFVPVLIAAAASYLCTDSLCGLDVDALGGAIEGERRETDEEVAVTGGRGAGSFNRGDWGALALYENALSTKNREKRKCLTYLLVKPLHASGSSGSSGSQVMSSMSSRSCCYIALGGKRMLGARTGTNVRREELTRLGGRPGDGLLGFV
jgi:hypothetical protein